MRYPIHPNTTISLSQDLGPALRETCAMQVLSYPKVLHKPAHEICIGGFFFTIPIEVIPLDSGPCHVQLTASLPSDLLPFENLPEKSTTRRLQGLKKCSRSHHRCFAQAVVESPASGCCAPRSSSHQWADGKQGTWLEWLEIPQGWCLASVWV